ncbi:MAG: exodeoxyribonuclease VII large subunit, partial [Flavobacteriales bacterium]|nr:exodeoxyribonuclease VII large subunit [Flavobacteriales bacterium]
MSTAVESDAPKPLPGEDAPQGRRVYSLSQVSAAIQRQITAAAGERIFWIKAEIAHIRIDRHAYMELAEHRNGVKVAVLRGTIWHRTLEHIRGTLGTDAPHILKHGVEILFAARVAYHPVYGLSLHIEDIDPAFHIGELERRKKATIAQLRQEGLYDLNRFVPMPIVVQRVALITSPGSAAHTDFMKHLAENEHGYRFHVHLYPAVVQGDGAPGHLRAAFARIDTAQYDAVAIIRGGGSKLDLEPFNDLELARLVANCPVPVLTGIGHDMDISVLDLIARSHHKTPTAVADHLVDMFVLYESRMNSFMVGVHNAMLGTFAGHKERLSAIMEIMKARPVSHCQTLRGRLHTATTIITGRVMQDLRAAQRTIDAHGNALRTVPARRLATVEAARVQELADRLRMVVGQRMERWTAR